LYTVLHFFEERGVHLGVYAPNQALEDVVVVELEKLLGFKIPEHLPHQSYDIQAWDGYLSGRLTHIYFT
jgi:hypothetical protein